MAPKVAGKKGEKKAGKGKAAADGKKKRRRKKKESYAIYIYKVLKQVHPNDELVRQRHLRAHRHRSFPPCPLQQEINHQLLRDPTTIRLLLPGELTKHAVSEGTKYTSSK